MDFSCNEYEAKRLYVKPGSSNEKCLPYKNSVSLCLDFLFEGVHLVSGVDVKVSQTAFLHDSCSINERSNTLGLRADSRELN